LMAETTTSTLPEPDNAELVERVRTDIARRRRPADIQPEDAPRHSCDDVAEWDLHA
jgi:hypothetical protein